MTEQTKTSFHLVAQGKSYYGDVYENDFPGIAKYTLKRWSTYRILSRSTHIGIWVPERDGFVVWREGYGGSDSLLVEEHWDEQPYYTEVVDGEVKEWRGGTVKPFFLIEKSPFSFSSSSDLFRRCDVMKYLKKWCLLFPAEEQYYQYWKYIECLRKGLCYSPSHPLQLNDKEIQRAIKERRDEVQKYWERRKSRELNVAVHIQLKRE